MEKFVKVYSGFLCDIYNTDMITNAHRKKQLEEFLDKRLTSLDEYYNILETPMTEKQLQKRLRAFIDEDPDFFDSYNDLADRWFAKGKSTEAKALLHQGFERAVKRIVDKKGNWPKQMPWSWLDNRHVMRIIDRYAHFLREEDKIEEALDIFRRLLRTNPGDNQGARYEILAIRLGLGTDWEEPFIVQDGPMAGEAFDAMEVDSWFQENAGKFPDEFEWLFDEWEKMNG